MQSHSTELECILNDLLCFGLLRIVSNTRKFDRGLTHFRQSQLHWLDVVGVCVQVFRSLLLNTCRPTANPSPAFLVVATCDRLTVAISTTHV